MSETYWTIAELSGRAAEVLERAGDYPGARNGQVRSVPDLRTIRYYTTLGLLDRPAEMRGRTALYGRRHLEQLVAIKRLQAQGLSLAAIQERLTGCSEARLRALAAIPAEVAGPQGGARAPAARRDRFWLAAPAAELPAEEAAAPASVASRQEAPAAPAGRGEAPAMMARFEVAPGVALLVDVTRAPSAAEAAAVRRAAASLVDELENRGLVAPRREEERHD